MIALTPRRRNRRFHGGTCSSRPAVVCLVGALALVPPFIPASQAPDIAPQPDARARIKIDIETNRFGTDEFLRYRRLETGS